MATNGYISEVDYLYGYYPETSPVRLKLALLASQIGHSLGESPNYLELGFGQGLSLSINAATNGGNFYGTDFNPAQEYHDIKDIIEVTPEKEKEWWCYATGGVLILLLMLYLLRKRKPKPIVTVPAVIINPYEEAINNLRELSGDYADIKRYHSRLADIFRLYIFRKKGILSLQKTTDDLVLQLKNLGISKVQYDQLAQSLRLGDFVKFAKYVPAEEDNRLAFETVKKTIDEIERLS